MVREHGETAVSVMHSLKQTLDTHGILNPGKILPGPLG
jgi:FAD/FMN-containing dehydrogenase